MKKLLLKKGLVIAVILSFIGSGFVSAHNSFKTKPLNNGNWLYVGGSGEGNYSKIQDAIDAASDGDTVFVYAHSSPYTESIRINVSLRIMGENRSTTAITGNKRSTAVVINASNVTLSGFTITDPFWGDDIWVLGDNATIQGNIIRDAECYGIRVGVNNLLICANSTIIRDNIICNNSAHGIELVSYDSIVRDNIISNNDAGIQIYFGQRNSILGNQLFDNNWGISIGAEKNLIQSNNVFNNTIGIGTWGGPKNRILANNIYDYSRIGSETISILHLDGGLRNIWDGNFWGKPYSRPKPIPTCIGLDFLMLLYYYVLHEFKEFYVIIKGGYDFHPAKEPYVIPTYV